MRSVSSDKIRHILLRGAAGDVLPDSIAQAMDREQVASGLLRGSGVLEDVVLRAHGGEATRALAGRAYVVVLDGRVDLAEVALRAVIARETDRGLETLSGEIVSARVVALDAHVTAFDDVSDSTPPARESRPAPLASKEVPKASGWSQTLAIASAEPPRQASPSNPSSPAVMPARPVKARVEEEHQPVPEVGDVVEHFAFGPCDVMKSEDDRLHVRLPKDQRIKEIALEMLRVTELPSEGPHKRYRLDRKLP